MFGRVTWVAWYNGISNGGFPVYVEGEVLCTSLHCDVQEIDSIIYFLLYSKYPLWVFVIEGIEDFIYVGDRIIVCY